MAVSMRGRAEDRKDDADRMVRSLLPMFEDLLAKTDKNRAEQMAYARLLDPKLLVLRDFQISFAAYGSIAVTKAQLDVVPLTFINPFISLSEADETSVPAADRVVMTYSESQKAKRPRESKEESAARFATELERIYAKYVDRTGPPESFEQVRRTVFEIIRAALLLRVDAQLMQGLAGKPIPIDPRDETSGTPFTRLHQSLEWIVASKDGTLNRIAAMIDSYAQSLAEQKNTVQRLAVDAVSALRAARPLGLFGKLQTWVEGYQLDARSRMADLVRWHQQTELLAMTQQLLQALRNRYASWYDLFTTVLRQLALSGIDRQPALHKVHTQHIARLRLRLLLLANDRTSLISFAHSAERDTNMQGFADRLRQEAMFDRGVSLVERALDGAAWELSASANGDPQIALRLCIGDENIIVASKDIAQLHDRLQHWFRKRIENVIDEKTIFDYLDYLYREKQYTCSDVVSRLSEATTLLIDTEYQPTVRLFYRRSRLIDHQRIVEILNTQLKQTYREAADPEETYSDPYSLTLLTIVFPDRTEILKSYQDEYLRIQVTGSLQMDQQLRRAPTFHIFRAEQEAWYLERQMWLTAQRAANESERLSPRLVRLLDHPERIRAFVKCVATGVVAFNGEWWLFHDRVKRRDFIASQHKNLMRAMTVFILQRTEDCESSLAEIDLASATESATIAAKEMGKRKWDIVQNFIDGGGLDTLLEEHIVAENEDKHLRQ